MNGVVERSIRTIWEMTRCMLFECVSQLNRRHSQPRHAVLGSTSYKFLWPLAMDYAIHTLNKLPTKGAANGRSSPEALFSRW